MAMLGLNSDVVNAVALIAEGRRLLYTDGTEHDGRITFEEGHRLLRDAYAEAENSGSVRDVLLAEISINEQEIAESDDDETLGRASAEAMRRDFSDAIMAFDTVNDAAAYSITDKVFAHKEPFRYKGLPNDAFHAAMSAHTVRLQNQMKRLGLPKLDRELGKVRLSAIKAIQDIYCGLQRKALM
jgi:hypothetical protein